MLSPPKELLTRASLWMLPIWVIALFGHDRRVYDMIEMIMLPIIVLGLGNASRYAITIPQGLGDISYGVYVYHFAVALAVAAIVPPAFAGWPAVLAALVISVVTGWLSFHFVEKRALAQKNPATREAVADVSVAARVTSHEATQ